MGDLRERDEAVGGEEEEEEDGEKKEEDGVGLFSTAPEVGGRGRRFTGGVEGGKLSTGKRKMTGGKNWQRTKKTSRAPARA